MMRAFFLAVALVSPAHGAEVRGCGSEVANARNVLWEDPTRVFANGAIRFIMLDTEEPACCSVHVMVLHPVGDDPFLACSLISRFEGSGWLDASLRDAASDYIPGSGLRVSIPMQAYGEAGVASETLHLTVNQATGKVTAE